jgi:cell division transport system permease protein
VKFDYVLRETTTNLRRNITLTIAAIVATGVSLALFGSTLLVGQGVDNVSQRWNDGIEVIAFLKSDVTPEQREAIEGFINDSPEVGEWRYVDLDESRQEALRLFARNEALRDKIENGTRVPDSYRLSPESKDVNLMRSLGDQLLAQPGVELVTDESESVKTITAVSHFAQLAMLVIGIVLLVAALLLILNAIRMAMFARRREIEVMKLVGATNWFIRVPFMMEGIVQGLIGALFAVGALVAVDRAMDNAAQNRDYQSIMEGFVASAGEVRLTVIVVILLGMTIGAAGSAWALSRFLRV